MATEKVTIEQAVQKLSEANNNNITRLTELEKKMSAIYTNIIGEDRDRSNSLSNEITNLQNTMTNQIETIQTQTRQWQDTTKSRFEENQQQWNHITDDVRELKAEIQKICKIITRNQVIENDDEQLNENRTYTPRTDHNISTINDSLELTRPTQGNTTHTIVIPPTSAIPTFNGNLMENPRQFLIRVKEYTETINQWNDQSLLNGISQFLRGAALEWHCQLRISHRRPQSWIEFTNLFLNQFNSPVRRARQEQQWKECRQEENETINEFIVRLQALWREQKPKETEDDLVRHLMCKMRNNILTMIGVSRCGSLDEIITEAQKVEEILYQRSKQQCNNYKKEAIQDDSIPTTMYGNSDPYEIQAMSAHQTQRHSNSYSKRNYETTNNVNNFHPRQYKRYSSYPTNNHQQILSTNETQCYTCGKRGHIAKNCRSQYNSFQQQHSWYYPKNDNGAPGGRDHNAPI